MIAAGKVGVALVVAGAALAGCRVGPSEGGPTLICGQNLAGGYVEPHILDVTSGNPTVGQQAGDTTFLLLTNSCQEGVQVSVVPAAAARIVRSANASDGRPAAIELWSSVAGFRLVLTTPGARTRTVTFAPGPPFVLTPTP